MFKRTSNVLHKLSIGEVYVYESMCVFPLMCVLVHIHIFSCCVYSIFLDVCVYTPGLPSVTHSDIDLCMASVCVCVCLHTYTSYNWYSNLLPQVRPTAAVFQLPELQPRSKQHDGEQAQTDGSHCTHSNKQMEVI